MTQMKIKNNYQTSPCIICVALTGSVPRKKHNKNIPISINEQIESAHECFEEGATIAHCHVRNNDESISLISRLSSNVKEKAINVGSKAISMVSEVANKSLENKFMKKDEIEDIKSNEFNSKERVEPSFMSLENNEENKLNAIDSNTTMQETNYNNIPSFLKRNRE